MTKEEEEEEEEDEEEEEEEEEELNSDAATSYNLVIKSLRQGHYTRQI